MKQVIKIRKTPKIGIEITMGAFMIFPVTIDGLKELAEKINKYIKNHEWI